MLSVLMIVSVLPASWPPGPPTVCLAEPSLYIQSRTEDPAKCERGSWSRARGYRRLRELRLPCPRMEREYAGGILRLYADHLMYEIQGRYTRIEFPVATATVVTIEFVGTRDIPWARGEGSGSGIVMRDEEAVRLYAFNGARWYKVRELPAAGEERAIVYKLLSPWVVGGVIRRDSLMEYGQAFGPKSRFERKATIEGAGFKIGKKIYAAEGGLPERPEELYFWIAPERPYWGGGDPDVVYHGRQPRRPPNAGLSARVLCENERCRTHAPVYVLTRDGRAVPLEVESTGPIWLSQQEDLIVVTGREVAVWDARTLRRLYKHENVNFAFWEQAVVY